MQSEEKHNINKNPATVPARPNEAGQLHLDDFVRIFDPNNQEVLLEKRS